MINFEVKGAIFDVDETLSDNGMSNAGYGLHEQSRLQATHEIGQKYEIAALAELSTEDNLTAFVTAATHSLQGAVWNTLRMVELVDTDEVDPNHYLLNEIIARKAELHPQLIASSVKEIEGASLFVHGLARKGIELAIASSGARNEIDLFLGKVGLEGFFRNERIISVESVTYTKPHPEPFDRAFQTLGLPDSNRPQVCAFEDNPRGIISAKRAGLFTCAITTCYTRQELMDTETPPDLVADSYQEFSTYFNLD